MPYNFIRSDCDQIYLLPPNMKDWLPQDHLAWFLPEAVDQMDLSGFCANYREEPIKGQAARYVASYIIYQPTDGRY